MRKIRSHSLFISAALLCLSSGAVAQQLAFESPAGTKFLLYTPAGYTTSTSSYPLLLSLHSKGEVGDDLAELTSKNPEQMPSRLIYLNRWPQHLPFIVLTPQLRPTEADPDPQWPAAYIDEVVRHVLSNYRVDLNRIYVTGISRGGTGAWTYASAFPEKVAALLPLSGRSDLSQACPIKDIPIWAFHGDADGVAPTHFSVDMINAVKACQPVGDYKPRLDLLHARAHNGWNEVYNGSNGYRVFEWLLMFRKNDTSNKTPYVNAGRDLRIQLQNGSFSLMGDFFDWDGEITNVSWKQTGGAALTLDNVNAQVLKLMNLQKGLFEFELTVTDDQAAQSSDKITLEITDTTPLPHITSLVLMNGKTNLDIGNLFEGQIVNKAALGLTEINIKAITSEGTGSVMFSVNTDQNTRIVNSPGPYFIKNQTTGPEWVIADGEYVICATPFPQTNARGIPGTSQCFRITFVDGPPACVSSGKTKREVWTNISGSLIASIPVTAPPNYIDDLSSFESPANWGDNYGSRIRSYICPPVTGNYTFWIASNDKSELWLSTDDNPAHKKLIASVGSYANVREWTKLTTQKSAFIRLVQGQRYYIEALHKEGSGTDHLAVGWQLPDGTLERPIHGIRLTPYLSSGNQNPVVSISSPVAGQSFQAPASISINATASDPDGTVTKVEFYNGTAILGEDTTAPFTNVWNNVSAGNYTIRAKAIDNAGASATASMGVTVSPASTACVGTGTIQQEMWTGIAGATVGSIPLDVPPSVVNELTIFEDPTNVGDNFGTRVSGYICAPQTGAYVFWISSNDNSQLFLSSDDSPANKSLIASVSSYTNVRQWTKFSSQQSLPVNLLQGQRYYIEALHKEGVGSDHMAVGWQLPDGVQERPIPGNRLASVNIAATSMFVATGSNEIQPSHVSSSGDEQHSYSLEIFPNSIDSNLPEFTISLNDDNDGGLARVEIVRMTGEVVYTENITSQGNGKDYHINRKQSVPPGLYLVTFTKNGKRFTKRLVVK
jgi:predicted esterase